MTFERVMTHCQSIHPSQRAPLDLASYCLVRAWRSRLPARGQAIRGLMECVWVGLGGRWWELMGVGVDLLT
jgi:hypothetical protein